MVPYQSLGPGMAVIGALSLASLCAECIGARARLPLDTVMAELAEINAARDRRGRAGVGPIDARCQRCEAARAVYRFR